MRKPNLHKSFGNAFRGMYDILRSERNFKIETAALLINLVLLLILKVEKREALILILCSFCVLSAEIFNTAIEKICDIVKPEFDERVRFIKDISAGAVLLLAGFSVIAALWIYPHYLVEFFSAP